MKNVFRVARLMGLAGALSGAWFSNNVVAAANLFVSDTDESGNGVINEFNTAAGPSSGVAVISGLPSPSGEPEGLAFNSSGDLFAAENTSPVGAWPPTGCICKFTPNGAGGWVQSTFASGLALPCGLAFNSSGDLFVADSNAQSIYEITPGGTRSTFATFGGDDAPVGLAFNSSGDLFATDFGYSYASGWVGYIMKFTPGGAGSTFASGLIEPDCLAFDASGNLFVGDSGVQGSGSAIDKFTPGGVETTIAGGGYETGLAFDGSGNLFVCDYYNAVISKLTPSGGGWVRSTFASYDNGDPVNSPFGLAFQPPGPGDVNGDGRVDINDLTIVLANYGRSGCVWSQGCMDGDPTGTIDVNDLTIVLSNYGHTYGSPAAVAVVPEPASLGLLSAAIACAALWVCRRRN